MIGGVVLAAGGGRRFGGPKQLAELGGRPLIEHALEAMRAAPVDRRFVVLGAEAERIEAEADTNGFELVACPGWSEGMAASLRGAVAAARDCEVIVITLADQPLIPAEAISRVIAAGGPAVRATYGGRPGHPVLLSAAHFDAVLGLRGDSGARDLLHATGATELELGALCSDADVDTEKQLEEIRRRLVSPARGMG